METQKSRLKKKQIKKNPLFPGQKGVIINFFLGKEEASIGESTHLR